MADSKTPLSGAEAGSTLFRLRVELVREVSELPAYDGEVIRGPDSAFRLVSALLDREAQECFLVLLLSVRHVVTGYHVATRGVLDATLVHPREIFRAAILGNAASIIVAHNHPSGDPAPSREDRVITRQLAEAGRVLGIPLLDHIVIGCGTGTYQSLAGEI